MQWYTNAQLPGYAEGINHKELWNLNQHSRLQMMKMKKKNKKIFKKQTNQPRYECEEFLCEEYTKSN